MTTPLRILVVEDSPSVGAILTCAFEQEGCTTALARSGSGGIELAQQWHPDLIALDLSLGGDVVAALRADQRTRDIPIVAISAPSRDLPRGVAQQLARIFGEPFYPAEVVAAAMEALQSPARLGR